MAGTKGIAYAISAACAVCALALGHSAAPASPLRLFGFGGKSPGMGGTGVASSDGFESVYLNPAGLARPIKRFTLGASLGAFSLAMDGDAVDTDIAHATVIGAALPLRFGGALKDRVGFGIGMYVPNATLNKVKSPAPGDPSFTLLENTAHVIGVQFGTGVQVTDRFSAGAGLLVLAALRGQIHVSADAAGRFSTQSEQQLITQFAPVIGVRYSGTVSWGLTFRGVSKSNYDITVTNELGDFLPVPLPPLRIAGTPQYDPLTVALEAAFRPRPSVHLALQLAYEHWSAYPLPTENVLMTTPDQDDPGFTDTVVPRLGAEWRVAERSAVIDVRGGYSFSLSPAPEMTGQQSFLDNHRHAFAFGIGAAWPKARLPLYVDAWVQGHVLQPRSHTKDADAFGPDDPAPFDTVETDGTIVMGGLTVGVDL